MNSAPSETERSSLQPSPDKKVSKAKSNRANIDSFTDASGPIRTILQSQDVPELIENSRVAILKVFKAESVDFLMMDKEIVT
jgi:hypothetical protein